MTAVFEWSWLGPFLAGFAAAAAFFTAFTGFVTARREAGVRRAAEASQMAAEASQRAAQASVRAAETATERVSQMRLLRDLISELSDAQKTAEDLVSQVDVTIEAKPADRTTTTTTPA